jgi:diguanylate cyclase (GGDEF)-like protein
VRVAYTVSPIAKDGQRAGAVIVLRDVTRQRDLEHDLRHQALHDSLTGLPNRALLHEHIAAADPNQNGAALLLIDLGRFKEVNDTLGHHYGDQLLIEVARRMQNLLRRGELVARLGGDEFAVLLPGLTDVQDVAAVAARIHDALDEPFPLDGINLTVGARSWLKAGHEVPVAVNISTHRLLDLNFPTEVSIEEPIAVLV